ncbi:5-(carboxyamino)imidazole ribonucleotide synthase [Pelomicrobium methylotrophicum]|uniref:N5-carboxyaminoimidazole ribonucleotide synthase n=1 Tax=Pelomicrobium methylotrophicum TaxID=2602750 RepID=A0A5C7ENJ0_9PROT|nr:5-(carboxyamino)imidazole ribonucleotide synthase [Pelomicrobium methylotrophicum]TXF13291.1 5-(carboxyamino)imidazole ribonucleotide synthase [Pelomicrobium methylotrophicum]
MIPPGATLGLLGGGQLGRMFTMAAQRMGYRVAVLDPGLHSPAGDVADEHILADYDDPEGLAHLARSCAAATTEFENVPAEALRFLAQYCVVSPAADSVAVAQDRIREKEFLAGAGFEVTPFAVIREGTELEGFGAGMLYPGILKVSRFGYDGKGQASVAGPAEALRAWRAMGGEPCVLEKRMSLAAEVSVVVARDFAGRVCTFPVAENQHRHGILDVSIVPARVPETLAEQARSVAVAVAQALDYRGVLCVEMFVLGDGRLLVNEIAPRPHNSGHYTLDACVTSQFEQQVRVLAGLPLGDPGLHCPAVMVNLLGDLWAHGEPDWRLVLEHPRAKLHLYGKREARPRRKMGHYTVLADSVEAALSTALAIKERLERSSRAAPAQPARA